jgi:hypothetical protein
MIKAFGGYMTASLADFHRDGGNRLLSYLLFFCSYFMLGMFAWTAIRGPHIVLAKMAFITVYTLHAAVAYTLGVWLMEAVLSQGRPAWTAYRNRSVGRQWVVWLCGYYAGMMLHKHVVKGAVKLYAPSMTWYRTAPPDPSLPLDLYFFLGGITVWLITACLVMSWIMRRQNKLSELGAPATADGIADDPASPSAGVLRVRTDGQALAIPHAHISHISVEDHYLRIFYGNGGPMRNVLIRQSLRKLLKQLPDRHFLRIHRSHVVNLQKVTGLKKHGKEKRVSLHMHDQSLPVSRHRLPDLRPRLEKAMEEQAH